MNDHLVELGIGISARAFPEEGPRIEGAGGVFRGCERYGIGCCGFQLLGDDGWSLECNFEAFVNPCIVDHNPVLVVEMDGSLGLGIGFAVAAQRVVPFPLKIQDVALPDQPGVFPCRGSFAFDSCFPLMIWADMGVANCAIFEWTRQSAEFMRQRCDVVGADLRNEPPGRSNGRPFQSQPYYCSSKKCDSQNRRRLARQPVDPGSSASKNA